MSVRSRARPAPVTTVVLARPERPERRRPRHRARALADAFRAFEADPRRALAVLFGEGGTLLRGRRPEARSRRGAATPCASRARRRADGADAHAAREAGHRRGRRPRRRRRARARALVRPARGGGGRGLRRLLPALGRAADRRRHRAAAAPHRPRPRARPDPHRPPGRRRGGAAHRPRQPRRPARRGARRRRGAGRGRSPPSPRSACAPIACSAYEQAGLALERRARQRDAPRRSRCSRAARRREGAARFAAGRGRHGSFD